MSIGRTRDDVLQDHLQEGLDLVVCGTAAGDTSARERHYYAGPGNEFWSFLQRGGLTPTRLSPREDARILEFGIGLTDLAKAVAASSDRGLDGDFEVDEFLTKVRTFAPLIVAFHGKKAAEVVSRHLGHGRKVRYGIQPWSLDGSAVFVLPSASGSNRDERPHRLDGKSSRLDWYRELATEVRRLGGGSNGARPSN